MPPGGALELEETPYEGVVREVYEETGVKVAPYHLIGVYKSSCPTPVGIVLSASPVNVRCHRTGSLLLRTRLRLQAAFGGFPGGEVRRGLFRMPVVHHAYGPPVYRLVLPPVWPRLGRPLYTACRDEITLCAGTGGKAQAQEGRRARRSRAESGPPRRKTRRGRDRQRRGLFLRAISVTPRGPRSQRPFSEKCW
ncbi:NUDIX hydrolase [Microbispora rosea]|uniref:NUDIX hydrolase n=1 Tax=Microbispora rosea TaxID=58117 RepID=UPI0036BC396A